MKLILAKNVKLIFLIYVLVSKYYGINIDSVNRFFNIIDDVEL